MVSLVEKSKIIKKIQQEFGLKENDSGSPEVQICILNEELKLLVLHLQKNKKDFASKRALLKKLAKRKKLLSYLKKVDLKRYKKVLTSIDSKK